MSWGSPHKLDTAGKVLKEELDIIFLFLLCRLTSSLTCFLGPFFPEPHRPPSNSTSVNTAGVGEGLPRSFWTLGFLDLQLSVIVPLRPLLLSLVPFTNPSLPAGGTHQGSILGTLLFFLQGGSLRKPHPHHGCG